LLYLEIISNNKLKTISTNFKYQLSMNLTDKYQRFYHELFETVEYFDVAHSYSEGLTAAEQEAYSFLSKMLAQSKEQPIFAEVEAIQNVNEE